MFRKNFQPPASESVDLQARLEPTFSGREANRAATLEVVLLPTAHAQSPYFPLHLK